MTYIPAFRDEPVPSIPHPPSHNDTSFVVPPPARPPDRREHFGTEEAALRRAAELLPAPAWRQLRLYGPDGMRIADQAALQSHLAQATTSNA